MNKHCISTILVVFTLGCVGVPEKQPPLKGIEIAEHQSDIGQNNLKAFQQGTVGIILSQNTKNWTEFIKEFPEIFNSDAERRHSAETGGDTAGEAKKVVALLRTHFPQLSLAENIGKPPRTGYVVYDYYYDSSLIGFNDHRATTELKFIFIDSGGKIITEISGIGSEIHSIAGGREKTQKLLNAAVIKSFEAALDELNMKLKQHLSQH